MRAQIAFGLSVGLTLGLGQNAAAQKPISITFLHTNDLHAHVEPTAIRGKAFGGYARHATLFKQIRAKEKNVVTLNAGDVFQGTLYFNVYDGLADLQIMNRLGYQAMTLGNHEFDKGPGPLAKFIDAANFPILAANLDTAKEPLLKGKVKPYTILEVDRQKVGIVGVITAETPSISSPGDTVKFWAEADRVQSAVDELTAQGVNKIVVMSHVGYENDKAMASRWRNVDLIIGGHSHTPLGTPALPGWRPSGGPYPTEVTDKDGKRVLIVQAWEWGKVVGRIRLNFDAKGEIRKVEAAEAIVVDESIPEDKEIANLVEAFRLPLLALESAPIGTSDVAISDRTLVGYFVADAMLEATKKFGAVAAFMNPGGVRANIEAGKFTYGMANSISPFRNTLVLADLKGSEIVAMLEKVACIPSAGSSYRQAGGVRDVVINGQPLNLNATYKVVVNNFMAGGGDGLDVLKGVPKVETGLLDIDSLVDFIKAKSPLKQPTEIRIKRGN